MLSESVLSGLKNDHVFSEFVFRKVKPIRVVIVSALFPPEPVISARTSFQIAQELQRRGCDVTVVAPFPSRPQGFGYPGWRRALWRRETINGIGLVRCFSFYSQKSTLFSRSLEHLSFGVTGAIATMARSRPDVIYANTWPITATTILAGIAAIRHIPLVMSVQDLYPESLISQGVIREAGPVSKAMYWLDGLTARVAETIILISKPLAEEYLKSREACQKVRVIPNWVDANLIDISCDQRDFRGRAGIPEGSFVAVFGGNVGAGAHVEGLIEAVCAIERGDLRLVVAGDGPKLGGCRELAESLRTTAVSFWSPWEADETSLVLRGADVLVLPTRGNQTEASVPSKLMTYMLAGRPIIVQAIKNSESAMVVRQCDCGWVAEPDDVYGLSAAISQAIDTADEDREAMGKRARIYALEKFAATVCLPKVIEVIEHAAKGRNT